jgi:hypothetical protein
VPGWILLARNVRQGGDPGVCASQLAFTWSNDAGKRPASWHWSPCCRSDSSSSGCGLAFGEPGIGSGADGDFFRAHPYMGLFRIRHVRASSISGHGGGLRSGAGLPFDLGDMESEGSARRVSNVLFSACSSML